MKKHKFDWGNKKVLVTGGASFIGSHIVDELVKRRANVRVVDNLSSGTKENIKEHLNKKTIEFIKGDLLDSRVAKKATKKIEIVFHLANDHGGRGYVDFHQANCSTNLILDGNVFYSSLKNGVEKIVFASSGCVYPNYLQKDNKKALFLTEDLVKPPYDADNIYGWTKLMGELTLKAYAKEWGVKTASCRFFTVYGDRGKENHAVLAMIARAFIKQNPFIVWGTGGQIRNWTYVSDIVKGMILAAEIVNDGTSVNLGTTERIRVIDAVNQILQYTDFHPKIVFRPAMPTGPYNRVADNKLAKKLLGWEPQVKFIDGLRRTIDWYFATKNRDKIKQQLNHLLLER